MSGGGKIQTPLRKFLYGGRVEGLGALAESQLVAAMREGVKLEYPGETGGQVDGDCEIDKVRSTPFKPGTHEVVIGPEAPNDSRKRKSYDHRRHFQESWDAKLPWAQSVVGESGVITQVRCKICSDVEGREKLLVPKLDSMHKHAGRRRATVDMGKVRKGENYYLGNNQHVKNERVFFAKGGQTVVTKVLVGVTKERRRKIVQFRCCLQILQQGRPMVDYSTMQELLTQLQVPELPKKHWNHVSGWDFAIAVANVCSDRLKRDLAKATCISASVDEVTSVDNSQWLSIHVYFSVNFARQSHMISVRRVDIEANAANLTELITEQIFHYGGLSGQEFAEKLICFGADGAAVFQGARSGVIQRLKSEHAPFVIPVLDFAHRTNFAVEAMSYLPFVQKLEALCKSLHSYFANSPKRHLEFKKLAEVVETERLKILKQVQTRWISLLEPLKRISAEYKTLIAKFAQDAPKEGTTKRNLTLLLDVATLLALPCILPMLECIQSLIKFAQARNVFISGFIGAVKICQGELFMMYVDPTSSFQALHFQAFHDVVDDHSHTIFHEWVTDLNNGHETLSFRIAGHTFPAHMVDAVTGQHVSVSREDLKSVTSAVKGQCTAAGEMLISQLDRRFPNCDIMEALGVVFPQYWLQQGCDDLFPTYLQVIREWFCELKSVDGIEGNSRNVKAPLDGHMLSMQQCLFKLTMKSHALKAMEKPDDVNPVTKMWQKLGCNALLLNKVSGYFKLAEIAITAIFGSVEDERTFSTLTFLKPRSGTDSKEIWTLASNCSHKHGTILKLFLITKHSITGGKQGRGRVHLCEMLCLMCLHNVNKFFDS